MTTGAQTLQSRQSFAVEGGLRRPGPNLALWPLAPAQAVQVGHPTRAANPWPCLQARHSRGWVAMDFVAGFQP